LLNLQEAKSQEEVLVIDSIDAQVLSFFELFLKD